MRRARMQPRLKAAVAELQDRIAERYPQARFAVFRGEEPNGVYLEVTVDLEDTEEVLDTVRNRLVELQVDEGLPVYVLTAQPMERIMAERARTPANASFLPPTTP